MSSTWDVEAGPVVDLLTAVPLAALDEAATLDALADNQRARNLADFRDLELIAHYCALNSAPGPSIDGHDRPAIAGGETMIHPGGDGTPRLQEFAVMDVSVRIRRGHDSTRSLIADTLDLRYRLPRIWRRMAAGEVEVWRARGIARATHALTVEAAGFVDEEVASIADTVGEKRLGRIVQAAVIRADPEQADRETTEADDRQVSVSRSVKHGRKDVFIRADAADVIRFVGAIDFIADLLGLDGDTDPKRVRRTKAIGVLADPNAVLELFARTRTSPSAALEPTIAEAAGEDPAHLRDLVCDHDSMPDQDSLLDIREPASDPDDAIADFDTDMLSPEQVAALAEWEAAGWTNPSDDASADGADAPPECDRCGGQSWSWTREAVGEPDHDRSFPQVTLFVHMSQSTLFADTRDPCRLEYPGQASVPVTAEQAFDLIGHARVTVQPVIDLNDMAPVDGYEVRGRLRQAVFLKSAGACPFPYCDVFSKYAQCDHTINWPRGPSELGNLSPPDPTHHRVKTHGDWLVRQPFPGVYVWKDPFGQFFIVDHTGSRPIPRSPSQCGKRA
jgi:hypothetical protein